MQAAEVKQRIALQLKSFVQPTMAVTKRSQDAKKVIKASQSELVRAAKVRLYARTHTHLTSARARAAVPQSQLCRFRRTRCWDSG